MKTLCENCLGQLSLLGCVLGLVGGRLILREGWFGLCRFRARGHVHQRVIRRKILPSNSHGDRDIYNENHLARNYTARCWGRSLRVDGTLEFSVHLDPIIPTPHQEYSVLETFDHPQYPVLFVWFYYQQLTNWTNGMISSRSLVPFFLLLLNIFTCWYKGRVRSTWICIRWPSYLVST